MLNKIIDFSINNKLIIALFMIALIIFGGYQLTKLPIDAVPDITNNQIQVITVAPSLGATDIERLITFPIELANSNIPGKLEIRSFSRFGLSLVTIVFDDETDIYWARQQVAERLAQVQKEIPSGIGEISMGPVTTGLGEIYQYVIRPKEGYEHRYSPMELRTIQDWIVRRQLLGVEGVAEVSSFGGEVRQYEIAIEPNKLKAFNITITDVFSALEANNQNTGGAYIEKGPTVLYIRSEGLVGGIESIKSISIKNLEDGTPLFVKDVAEVRFGSATRYGALCYNNTGEVSGAVVMMLKGANASVVIGKIKERVVQIQKSLPEGVVLEAFLDRTKMVDNAIGTVRTNLIEGALIVLFVLIIFLGNIRAGFLVASVIPLAMLFAVILMNMFGVIGNLMSLGALDFGLIVDGSVFIVEAVLHKLTHSKLFVGDSRINQKQMDSEVSDASKKMARSVVFGQIIILIVYLPTFALQGIEGKMFIPMAQTVAFALLGALILSLTYVPMMSSLIMGKKINLRKNFSDRMMEFFGKHYLWALSRVVNFRKTVIISSLMLFALSIVILSNLGGEFIPTLEEGDFAVEARVLPGSNLKTTIASTQQAAGILKERFPEVIKVVTKIGSSEIPTDPMPMDAGDMIVVLKDKSEWASAKTFDELAEKMKRELQEVPGITMSFQFPVQMRFNELMTGAKQDIICKLFGEDIDTLAHYATEIGNISTSVEGTGDLFVEPVAGMPQLVIEYDRKAVAQYGLTISGLNKILNTTLAGQSAGFVYEGERRFDLVVRLNRDFVKDGTEVENILIPTPMGTQIPLYQLAKVGLKNSPNQIQREDAKRRIIVGFNAKGRDIQSIVNELKEKIETRVKLPAGYYITYGGAFENLNAAKKRLGVTVPVSLLLIFLLLFFSFNSVRQSLLIYSAIPLSAIGGILALALRGMPFSISAGVGFIALFGVAVLNGIVLIAEFNRIKKEDGITDLKQIVLKGTKVRLRPVLMTGFVASLGFLPMALSNGAGAEVQRPLATVVIGGLLIATFLTLFVLPVLYILFEKNPASETSNGKSLKALIVLFGLFGSLQVSAQSPITLNAALDTALKNNLSLKGERLRTEYHKKLIRTATDIPQAIVSSDYGQFNSRFLDTKFSFTQSFDFPSVYSKQKRVLNSAWKESVLNSELKETELKKQVTSAFYFIRFLNQKKQLLLRIDSIYERYEKTASLRFSKGESNMLEKVAAGSLLSQIRIQLREVDLELELAVLRFRILLNSEQLFLPDETEPKSPMLVGSDSASVLQNTGIKLSQQQVQTALFNTHLERSKLLPALFVGYSNQSIRGMGADNQLYYKADRFQSVQAGIGVPLFSGTQRARINSAKSLEQIADFNFRIDAQLLQSQWSASYYRYTGKLQILKNYEDEALKNAAIIVSLASLQFEKGEIDYLRWVQLINQATEIENRYVDALKELNDSIIELNFLLIDKKY